MNIYSTSSCYQIFEIISFPFFYQHFATLMIKFANTDQPKLCVKVENLSFDIIAQLSIYVKIDFGWLLPTSNFPLFFVVVSFFNRQKYSQKEENNEIRKNIIVCFYQEIQNSVFFCFVIILYCRFVVSKIAV